MEYSPRVRSIVVRATGAPPRSGIRISPEVCDGATTMVPSAAQAPPRGLPPMSASRAPARRRPRPSSASGRRRTRSSAVGREKRLRRVLGAGERPQREIASVRRRGAAFRLDRLDDERDPRGRGRRAPRIVVRNARRRELEAQSGGRRGRAPSAAAGPPLPARPAEPATIGHGAPAPGRAARPAWPPGLGVLLHVEDLEARVADVLQACVRIAAQTAPQQRRTAGGVSAGSAFQSGSSRRTAAAPRRPIGRRTWGGRRASRTAGSRTPRRRSACRLRRREPARGSCSAPCRARRRPE